MRPPSRTAQISTRRNRENLELDENRSRDHANNEFSDTTVRVCGITLIVLMLVAFLALFTYFYVRANLATKQVEKAATGEEGEVGALRRMVRLDSNCRTLPLSHHTLDSRATANTMFSRLLILTTLLGAALGAAVHHPGHVEQHPVYLVSPARQVVHHHVEPVMYVYPVNTRHFMVPQEHVQPGAVSASCNLTPSSVDGLVRGLITLHQQQPGAPVLISGTIEGLTPGLHGFHLHRDGKTTDGCKDAGPHFNPANVTHAGPNDQSRHAGDFGNIDADFLGVVNVNFATPGVSLQAGAPDSMLGRAFVVHAKADDLGRGRDAESLKTGNAGARVACCVVAPH
ncbi:hypothetical protein B566_EDAN013718 [Ephemera danica]|nr:hypothetical protein B566_EDAN013718 [Ephemera danica]